MLLPEFTRNLSPLKIDVQKRTKTLNRVLGQLIRESARVWLREWLALGIPVETGAAKATLQPIGRFLRVAVPIVPKRKPYHSALEGGTQDIGMGHEKQTFEITDDRNNSGSWQYSVFWSTTMRHYMLHEYYRGGAMVGADAHQYAMQKSLEWLQKRVPERIRPVLANLIEVE